MTRFNLSSNIWISFLHIFFTHEETIINNYPFSDIIEKRYTYSNDKQV